MPWYLWALAIGAIVVTWLSWPIPRARWWVALGAASFVISSAAHDAGMAQATQVGAFTNLVVICALFAHAERFYELIFWGCFIVMLMIDVLHLSDYVKAHYDFAIALEAINWVALLSIGTAGIIERYRRGIPYLSVKRLHFDWAGAFDRGFRSTRSVDTGTQRHPTATTARHVSRR